MSGLSLLTNSMGLSSTCTPTKDGIDEVLSIITPEMKKNLFQTTDEDDDSGIGMEFKKLPEDLPVPRFSAICSDNPSESLTPDICFQIRKPKRTNTRNSLFSSKRLLEEDVGPSAKMQRCDDTNFKRWFSFGDQAVNTNSPMRIIESAVCRLGETDELGRSPVVSVQSIVSHLSENHVQSAVSRLSESQDLIADGSSTFCLPMVRGQHPDLKSISPVTMLELLNGHFDHTIDSYKVIDCRYPYEFAGGHIKGAENRYTHESILELLTSQSPPKVGGKRKILVFHCEFSSERAPKLCRFLRQKDREQNKEHYPALNYPEVYILHGGYKAFYEHQKDMCDPIGYKPMLHSDHSADLRHFRIKSKSWTAGEKRRYALKTLRF
ncbi:STG [Mytilus coruscus]|uniref:M-phase inducer phosphatase n=1 Tax=Mytilus coruscus TaxID=42192 RepID=A0A6J8A034_MYTCO|nr:STG [Mytilus coruscus]